LTGDADSSTGDAATALTDDLTVVTPNGRDFEAAGVEPIRELPRADFAHGEHIPRAYVDEPSTESPRDNSMRGREPPDREALLLR
jgi:hypothetical protein